jgi:lipopolysaccharide assembly outer membrane protein LptD (OstA)
LAINFKSIALLSGAVLLIAGLSTTYINSARLVNNFEKNIESKEFIPEANSIEVSEVDVASHRSWKIKAEKSVGDSAMNEIESENIKAMIFDEKDNLKIEIKSPKAHLNRTDNTATLQGPAQVLMVEKNTKMIADKFIIKKGKPFEAIGHVKILLSPDGSRQVNAAKAIISQTMDDITLYNVAQSPVSPNLLVRGGIMRMEHSGAGKSSKPQRIILSNGAWVKSNDTTCQSSRLDVLLDAGGNPSIAIFTGAPVATQKGTRIRANVIEYTVADSKVKARGNVRTELI